MSSQKNIDTPAAKSAYGNRFGKERSRFWIALASVFALAGGAVYWAVAKPQDGAGEAGSSQAAIDPLVTIAPVEERLVIEQDERLGRIAAVESVELRPEVSGQIVRVGFQSGELVEAGQVLFEIDARTYAAAVDHANAEVARAKSRAETAARESQRAQSLYERRAISSEEAELRASRSAEASADLLAAQAALQTAQINLERTQVRSPISGRVSRALVTKGNLVSGNPGGATLLTTIVSTGSVHVYVDVDEATVQRFRSARSAGRILLDESQRVPVELRLDQSNAYTHRGYVESLDNHIDPQTGSLTVRLLFDDPNGALLPGAFARIRLPLSGEESKLVVNERAIGTDQSQKYVLVVQADNTVAYRAVSIGEAIGSERIVESGLQSSERVIVNGIQRVRPGMTVQTQVAATAAASSSQVATR